MDYIGQLRNEPVYLYISLVQICLKTRDSVFIHTAVTNVLIKVTT